MVQTVSLAQTFLGLFYPLHTEFLKTFPNPTKINQINDISASISESAAAQSKLLGDALEICLNLKGAEVRNEVYM